MIKSDEELMKDYASNDNASSFELLYHRYSGKVLGYVMNRIKDRTQSEEVHQNAFLKLHQYRSHYRPEYPFAPWFFTIVRSVMLDLIRKNTRERIRNQEVTPQEFENISDDRVNAIDDSNRPDLEKFKKTLSKDERREIEMRYEDDFSFEKMAQELGLSESSIRKRISRSLKKMRKRI
jgi:RNA polymerase sigma-70 factor (ECF subfamily)